MRKLIVGAALFGLNAPALAQTMVSTQAPIPSATNAVEGGRIAVAQKIAGRILPDGIYQKMLSGTMDQLMSGMIDQMMDLPLKDIVGMTGTTTEQLKALGPGTLKQILTVMDPAFRERMDVTMRS